MGEDGERVVVGAGGNCKEEGEELVIDVVALVVEVGRAEAAIASAPPDDLAEAGTGGGSVLVPK